MLLFKGKVSYALEWGEDRGKEGKSGETTELTDISVALIRFSRYHRTTDQS
jgi:hypothetical protein